MSSTENLTLLGKSGVNTPTELLEKFPRPEHVVEVVMTSDEVTALCPVTGQPDQYTVKIIYQPILFCIESKSLKLKLQSYRDKGIFVEALSSEIAQHVWDSIQPFEVQVDITQKSRGGVSILATSYLHQDDVEDADAS